jgi:hypothetical protein
MVMLSITMTIFPKLYQDKGTLIQEIFSELEKEFKLTRISLASGEHRYILVIHSKDQEMGFGRLLVQEGGYELNLELSIFSPENLGSRFVARLLEIISSKATINFFEVKQS